MPNSKTIVRQQDGTEAVKELFSKNASTYGRLFGSEVSGNSYRFAKRAKLCRELTEGSSGRMLELACGTGEVTRSVLEGSSFTDARVSDISEKMISVCKSTLTGLGAHITYSVGSCFDLEDNQPFDLILCIGLVAHTGRLDEILKRARKQLNTGGRILLQSTMSDSPGGFLTRVLTDRRYERKHNYALSHFNNKQIMDCTRKSGFKLVRSRGYSAGFVFIDHLMPRFNFHLERIYDALAILPGSERIYLFEKK